MTQFPGEGCGRCNSVSFGASGESAVGIDVHGSVWSEEHWQKPQDEAFLLQCKGGP